MEIKKVDQEINSVYRYRSFNERTMNELASNYISASKPKTFNDPYDSSISYDIDLVMKYVYSHIKVKQYLFHKYESKKKPWADINLSFEDYLLQKNNLFEDYWHDNNENRVRNIILNEIRILQDYINEYYAIASFSAVNDNEVMWTHYANGGTGFVLEYEKVSLLSKKGIFLAYLKNGSLWERPIKDMYDLYSVEYADDKYDGTELIIYALKELSTRNKYKTSDSIYEAILNNFKFTSYGKAQQSFINLLTNKRKHWSYEQEWRLVLPFEHPNEYDYDSGVIHKHTIVWTCKPKAIYLGEFTHKTNVIQMMLYVSKMNIPLYQMKSSKSKNSFGLHPVLISLEQINQTLSSLAS